MLASREASLLMVVDLQEKLLAHMIEPQGLVAACAALIKAARLFGIPVIACEQYPRGLGDTHGDVRSLLAADEIFPKAAFSALGDPIVSARIDSLSAGQVVLCGVEAHVCVLQTALDLKTRGREVLVVADAVASRHATDKDLALARLRAHGVDVVSREMLLFEWTRDAADPRFRAISAMVR